VEQELASQKVSGEERKRLEQIVSKLNRLDEDSEDEGDDEDSPDTEATAEQRLEELAMKAESGQLCAEDLTEEEARIFHSELKRGSLGRLLSPWQPWWQRAGVVEVGQSEEDAQSEEVDGAVSSRAPPPRICCIEGRKPHASVAFTAVSALYAYVHTMRALNGEWLWSPMQAAPHLLHLCPGICSHQVYNSAHECFIASMAAAAALPGRGFGAEFDLLCFADVCAVVRGGADFSARAIGEIIEIVEACLAGGGHGRSAKLRRGLKKLEFLASFVFHHFELLQPLADAAIRFADKHEKDCCEELEAKNARDHDGIAIPERPKGMIGGYL
jgi:hypothetical protein